MLCTIFFQENDANEKLRIQIRQQDMTIQQLKKDFEEKKTKLEIEEAKHPSNASVDNKGWKSAVVTRMYEGKMKALEEDVQKKVNYHVCFVGDNLYVSYSSLNYLLLVGQYTGENLKVRAGAVGQYTGENLKVRAVTVG